MRRVVVILIALLALLALSTLPAAPTFATTAAGLRQGEFGSREGILAWINSYRTKRELGHVPEAVRSLSALGAFRDPENAGVFIGFLTGILASNPAKAEEI